MEDPFMFYAQPEPTKIMEGLYTSSAGELCSIGGFVSAGDGRSTGGFCSAQPKPMVIKKNMEEKVVKSSKDNPYGPWLQVSYNKNGMRGPKGRSGRRYTSFGWNVDNVRLLEVVGCLVVGLIGELILSMKLKMV
ncbi:hypothetical protein ACOSQ2_014114 [Xanthoceras sorbifolium]